MNTTGAVLEGGTGAPLVADCEMDMLVIRRIGQRRIDLALQKVCSSSERIYEGLTWIKKMPLGEQVRRRSVSMRKFAEKFFKKN